MKFAIVVVLASCWSERPAVVRVVPAAATRCPDVRTVEVALEVPVNRWRPCTTQPPPAEPIYVGDETIDRIRREDHRRALVEWSARWWFICGVVP